MTEAKSALEAASRIIAAFYKPVSVAGGASFVFDTNDIKAVTRALIAFAEENRRLREAGAKLADACGGVLSWADGGCSPYANNDIREAFNAVDQWRSVVPEVPDNG
ncbi:MAG: hypothetical protein JSR91_00370 [Proteobacteria bacterium]|nr:hypothetical protein [Pseudomonadota bacterium]